MTCSNNRIYNDSDLLQTPGSPSALDFDSPDIKMLLRIGNLCNNAHTAANDKESLDERQSIGQSTEIALLEFCRKAGLADSR